MGTYITLTAYGDNAENALEASEDKLTELESFWSATTEDSDIYQINQNGEMETVVHEETAEILRFALKMAERTDGVIDPTISPVISAWGFISREYHVPSEEEIEELLRLVDYHKVKQSWMETGYRCQKKCSWTWGLLEKAMREIFLRNC